MTKRLTCLFALVPLVILLGCSSFNRNVYHAENTSVDLVTGGVHAFNLFYSASTNKADAATLQALNQQRATVYAATKKFQLTASVTDQARLMYLTNSANTNLTTLQAALHTMLGQQTNVLNLIQLFTTH